MRAEDIFVPIFLFGGIAVVLWKFFETRHRERMALIEKGLDPSTFKKAAGISTFRFSPLSNLKWGLLALFVGAGILFAGSIERSYMWSDFIYPSSILISGGVALIVFYAIAARKIRKEEER